MGHGFFTDYPDKGLGGKKDQVASPAKGGTDLPLSHLSDKRAAGSSPIPEDAEELRKFNEQEGVAPPATK